MSAQRPAQGGNQGEIAPWGAIVVVVGVVMAWLAFHRQIAYVVLWARYVEAHLMFFDRDGQVALSRWLATTDAASATLGGLVQSGNVAGYSLRWVSLLFLLLVFGWLVKNSPRRTGRFSNKYSMKSLAAQESSEWSAVLPILDLDLPRVSLDDPLNGMRTPPRAYARRHGLLLPAWTSQDALRDTPDAKQLEDKSYILVGKATRVMEAQLGRRWEGVEALQPFERALFAAFAAQAGHDRKLAGKVLDAINASASKAFKEGNPALLEPPIVATALAKYGSLDVIVNIQRRHAYVRTVLMRLLEVSRNNGVLNAALFRWLKMADRVTWYCLADLGMNSSVESAGVRAHYLYEKASKTILVEKRVQSAVDGLIDELNAFLDDSVKEDELE